MFPKPQLHMQVFESKTQETNNYGEGDCPSTKTEQQQKLTNSWGLSGTWDAICYTEQWNLLHCCSLFTGERWAGIFTGTATPAPQLPQVHACLQKKHCKMDEETWIPPPVLSHWVRFLQTTDYVAHNLEEATLQWVRATMALVCPFPIMGIDPVTLPAQASECVQNLTGSAKTHYFNTTISDVSHGQV